MTGVPEHVLRKIDDCTFPPKYFLFDCLDQNPLKIFISSLTKSDDLFFSHRPQIVVFLIFLFNFPQHNPSLSTLSSLPKKPFITAHFRSSLHILCITARYNM